ncbi:MAG TPA: hypothetical protein VIF09_09645 [Polyangiaceae bacterium]
MRLPLLSLGLLAIPLAPCLLACDNASSGSAGGSAPSASTVVTPSATASAAPPATASASASAAASAAVPPPKCPAGLTGNAVPAFCIKLPPSYAVKDARTTPTKGSIAYDTGTQTDNLMISYDETPIASQVKDVEGELKFGGDKIEKKGDLPGGGKWYLGSHQDFERVVSLVKGPAGLTLKCSFAFKPKSAPPKDATEACKSIVVP